MRRDAPRPTVSIGLPALGLAAAALFCGFLTLGCFLWPFGKSGGREPQVFVPEHETAREQYWFAYTKHQETLIPPSDPKSRERRLKQILAGYQKVVDLFPDDRDYTPLAKLQIGELYRSYKLLPEALKMSESIIADYGDIEFIDAKARYDRGRALEELGRAAEAQQAYKDCMDRHKDSKDKDVLMVVGWCRRLYERVLPLDEKQRPGAETARPD